ncbi:MAG: DUF1822 family protein [Alkalinema sp. RU_4_3]|nr:DUF1822 family protein [Alkalinema sp. RU_4_3]
MTAQFDHALMPDYEPLTGSVLVLDDAMVDRAYALSQRSGDRTKRWSIYLNGLAVEAFQAWLKQERPELTLDLNQCKISEPDRPDGTTAAENLQLNGFNLCVVAIPSLPDSVVSVPRSVIEPIQSHFYVTIAIYEELRQASVQSFIRWDDLKKQDLTRLATNRDGSYALPTQWFNSELDRLLLYLACAEPEALPTSSSPSLRQLLVQPALQLGNWAKQQWQELEEQAGWLLIPEWQMAGALRSSGSSLGTRTSDDFVKVLQDLAGQGVELPCNGRAAYRTVQLGAMPLDLCVLTAPLGEKEWSLLLLVKPQDHQMLPAGLELQIGDGQSVLVQQQVKGAEKGSLYAQIVGEFDEQFEVTLSQPDGTALLLPPFVWQLAS